ncbi:CHAP domain-containing protein [Dictyobacter arantiisoli]|uniref:CHAP domain-containing protein n=1 Tax=Dictyobacter arantiisoli TaxID=2014874 RepID=UPI0011EBE912|nr:CHAP domain-containing protein [Dictyobacter arantiisoli]
MSFSDHRGKRKNIYRQRSRITPLVYDVRPPVTPDEQTIFNGQTCFFPYDTVHTPPLFSPRPSDTSVKVTPQEDALFASSARKIFHSTKLVHPDVPGASSWPSFHVPVPENASVARRMPMGPQKLPVVIRGNGKRKQAIVSFVPPGRRLVVNGAISVLLLFIAMGTLITILPMDQRDRSSTRGLFLFHSIAVRKNDTALIDAQSATATAVTVDGYDPGGGRMYSGVQVQPQDAQTSAADYGSLNRFFYGQCTYWVNKRYHQVTGHWIPWLGNAYQWAYQAPAYGWNISDIPNPHGASIMVFSPYTEGAGAYGHVAVVERVNDDGSILTSNWNWDGAWATLTWRTFYPGTGIHFIWYPG